MQLGDNALEAAMRKKYNGKVVNFLRPLVDTSYTWLLFCYGCGFMVLPSSEVREDRTRTNRARSSSLAKALGSADIIQSITAFSKSYY